MAQQLNLDIDDKFIRTLKSVTQVRYLTRINWSDGTVQISQVSLRDCSLTDRGLEHLLKFNLTELDIQSCQQLTVCRNVYARKLKGVALKYFHPQISCVFVEGSNSGEYQQIF